MDVVLIVYENS